MNLPLIVRLLHRLMLLGVLSSAASLSTQALAQPSNKPLLTNQAGAKPNLMIALDNSGSMAYPFHETYGIEVNTNAATGLLRCPAPLYAVQTGGGWVLGGRVDQFRANGQRCLTATAFDANGNPTAGNWSANNGVAYVPALTARNNMLAQRSADVNPVYYNPRTTYSPRIGPDYTPLTRRANLRFVSNANSNNQANTFYTVYRNNGGDGSLFTVNVQKPSGVMPAWATAGNVVYSLSYRSPFPVHVEYTTNGDAATPAFTYTYCRNATGGSTVETDPDGKEIGCSSVRRTPFSTSAAGTFVSVYAPAHPNAAGNTIQLPADHNRTDCAAVNSCNNAEELNNILNWYEWYSTRQLATSTAIGQSFAVPDFQGNVRIGYLPINDYMMPNGGAGGNTNLAITRNPSLAAPGTGTGDVRVLRGVRTLQGGSASNTEIYNFLNQIQSRGGTPLHNALTRVGQYYSVPAGSVENPWATNPSTMGANLTCRRSFNLLFSDGGWTGQPTAPAAGPNFDSMVGIEPTPAPGTGITALRYQPFGYATLADRLKYTPYPSTGTGGLADIAANYYWFTDYLSGLNDVQPDNLNPTYWQNMTTFTVGYLIRPTGEVTGTGLTFDSIETYKNQYEALGYAAATKPAWPTGNLLNASNQQKVDDFIHAGYTGGGQSFSARTADDVRAIFEYIIYTALSQSGRDAGVAVDSGGGDNSTLEGRIKYEVTYKTRENSGNIFALEVDADGNETGVTRWTAEAEMPAPTARRIFTMHGNNQPLDFLGRVDGFPTDIRDALRHGPDAARVADDDSFVRYLRGEVTVNDPDGKPFRKRASKYASMVNPPSVLMGGKRDFAYDLLQDGYGVEGRSSYGDFAARKRGYPESLFVATNAGSMHALSAEHGTELAAVMPRRSLKRMLHFAKSPYQFEYVLDGPISEHDIFDRGIVSRDSLPESEQWRAWRHLGVGSGGRGEQLIYAVNSPIKPGAAPATANATDYRRAPDRADFLWETGPDRINNADGGDVTVGYMANPSRSGQTEELGSNNDQRGHWIVAVNNGHYNGESNGEKAGLVVLDALTGDVIRTIPLPGGHSAGRGLSGVTLIRDYEVSTRVIGAYAGDANGNLWRFDLSGPPNTWEVTHGRPLFTVPGNRPIFGHPAWQDHPAGGRIVVFATGFMLEEDDLEDLGQQTIFGIWDRKNTDGTMVENQPFTPVTFAQLQEQDVLPNDTASRGGNTFFHITDNPINWATQRGWYMRMEFEPGERSVADVINFGTSVIITSTVLRPPASEEMCSISDLPTNYIYVLHALSASQSRSFSFDVDGDRRMDDYAVARLERGGFSRGVSVVRYFAERDGTPLASDPWPEPSNTSDPAVILPDSVRLANKGYEDAGESFNPKQKSCKGMRGTVIGIDDDALGIGVQCPLTGWNRTQIQLSAPPSN